MADFVLDASVTLAGILPDELVPAAIALLASASKGGAVVPSFWAVEVANGLLVAERRTRIKTPFRLATLADLSQLTVERDAETADHAWGHSSRLAARHGLSVYDAAYLELALRRGLPLATLDRKLKAAAQGEAVVIL